MNPESDAVLISEAELLRQAADWLTDRQLDAPSLRQVARQRGLDFATALLYQALRANELAAGRSGYKVQLVHAPGPSSAQTAGIPAQGAWAAFA